MLWAKGLSIAEKVALLICFPDTVTLSFKSTHPDAQKVIEIAADFPGSLQRCERLRDSYQAAITMRGTNG